jgi:hypothetical protein
MRTRIALAAAATAVASIAMTSTVHAGLASGAAHPAGTSPPVLSRAATIYAPGFLTTALSAVHRREAHRQVRKDLMSAAAFARAAAVAAHTLQMARAVDAWRAAHPAPAPVPPAAPHSTPEPVVMSDATSTTTSDWACIRMHESGDRYNTPAAPGGAYGFLESTWLSLGYSGWPYEAPPAVQDNAVLYLYNELGWQPWSTRFVCGL